METERLLLRELTDADYLDLKRLLQNEELMLLGWGKTYSDKEVRSWLKKIQEQYQEYGHSYYGILAKESAKFIGIAGLLPIIIDEQNHVELAYIIDSNAQGKGYAAEASEELLRFGLEELALETIIAQFVPENIPSLKVAVKLGMTPAFTYQREQNGITKEHLVYKKNLKLC